MQRIYVAIKSLFCWIEIMKILLIKRGAIGDLLMATPLIRQLKQKLNCQLDILVGKAASIAIKDNPYLDNTYLLEDSNFTLKGSFKLAKWLLFHRKKYDYVMVLDKHWFFNLLAKLIGSPVTGYFRQNDKISQRILQNKVLYHDVNRYHGLYYLDLLQGSRLAVADYDDIKLDLVISTETKENINSLCDKYNLTDYCIVVNSGGNNVYESSGIRMLPEDKILALLRQLLEQNKTIILLGGQLDYDNYAGYCQKLNHPPRLINLAGQLNLAESTELISRAQHFYTTDCGAMHLGIVSNLAERMTAYFGPTNPAHILPVSYLANSAIWNDEDIYLPQYQLDGSLRNKEPKYFDRLKL